MLTNESITFGKYKGSTLGHMLKDRNYCKWLLEQEWFQNGYVYLYNRVKDYNPSVYFLRKEEKDDTEDFLDNYTYFNMYEVDEVELPLTQGEKICYQFYLDRLIIEKEDIADLMWHYTSSFWPNYFESKKEYEETINHQIKSGVFYDVTL